MKTAASKLLKIYRILVVEDNDGDAFIIDEAFKECGYACDLTFVKSHDQAQRHILEDSYDLVLSDFGTIVAKAQSFVREVRKQSPRTPIVILSGGVNPNVAYDAGANAFVRKATSLEDFFGKIKGIMHFWVDVAELPTLQKVHSDMLTVAL